MARQGSFLARLTSLSALIAAACLSLHPAMGQLSGPTFHQLSQKVWTDALTGSGEAALAPLSEINGSHPVLADLRLASESLNDSFEQREALRSGKIDEVAARLDEELAKDETAFTLSEAVRAAVELQLLSTDKQAILRDPRVTNLMRRAETAAGRAESAGQWLVANELYYRLNVLLEDRGKPYKADLDRLAARLDMIRIYAPEQFWALRNDHQVQRGEDPLPEYNGLGESFDEKLDGITDGMLVNAVLQSVRSHIHQKDNRPLLHDMMLGGIEQVSVLITTSSLDDVFPGLGDPSKVREMKTFLEARSDTLIRPSRHDLIRFVKRLREVNERTVNLPDVALVHEFGNGAMGVLDEFSAIIWPDEMRRFERMTQGHFRGVGIQIQLDLERQMIKVVTPLEGTPAQRAGVRRDDLISKINGESAVGITLNQAVDRITGPENTRVRLTLERDDEEIDFELKRAIIKLPSVKGWRRTGAADDDWDWFVDPEHKIGYIRLVSFSEETTRDLRAAIRLMEEDGLQGLILDLRFNPGGLLTQAVSVANTFIERGEIVSTTGTIPGETRSARPSRARVKDIPVAVLVNEGSASASEIVSGAIRHYADSNDVRAVLVGQRTYGKGSVQNVWPLTNQQTAALKLTTQYYMLPGGKMIHREPGASKWGVEPHVVVDMLPEQITQAIELRQNADVLPIDADGNIVFNEAEERPEPDDLITKGIDIQLQTALVLLQTQTIRDAHEPQALLIN